MHAVGLSFGRRSVGVGRKVEVRGCAAAVVEGGLKEVVDGLVG